LRQTHSRQHPCICRDNHHLRRSPLRPRHQHSRQHPCFPHDPNPKSLTATSTQERSVAIRHASRKNGSFHQPKNSGSLATFAAIRRAYHRFRKVFIMIFVVGQMFAQNSKQKIMAFCSLFV
jgi:hypothetical protein